MLLMCSGKHYLKVIATIYFYIVEGNGADYPNYLSGDLSYPVRYAKCSFNLLRCLND